MASAANALSSLTSLGAAPSQSSTTSSNTAKAPTEQMFLKLLVAQMKNQDPTNPSDPTQFVTQLAQFSQLEQMIAIRSDLDKTAGIAQSTGATSQSTNPLTGLTTSSNTIQTTTPTQP